MRRGLVLLLLASCAEPAPPVGQAESEIRVCADGPVVEGIDVSKWQGEIDWDAVAGAGIRFAFIRTNHGLGILDEWYDFNWSEARRVGIRRGTYQYFAPDEDVIAQADLLLERMGPLEDGDLPPVLDVEEDGGRTAEQIVSAIHVWSDRVEAVLGVRPIIYTAKYFWQDQVGAPDDFLDHPLWVANYGVTCPLMADPWQRWDFWQYTSTGSVAGISGNVDRDHWNGTEEQLEAFAWHPLDPDPPEPDPEADPPGDGTPDGDDDDDPSAAVGGCSAGASNRVALSGALILLAAFLAICRFRGQSGTSRTVRDA
jgi:lysozyme